MQSRDLETAPSSAARRELVKLSSLRAAALAAGCSPGDVPRRPEERENLRWWTRLSFELDEKTFAGPREGIASGG